MPTPYRTRILDRELNELLGSCSACDRGARRGPASHHAATVQQLDDLARLALDEGFDAEASVSIGALLAGHRPPLAGATSIALEDYLDEILTSALPGLCNDR